MSKWLQGLQFSGAKESDPCLTATQHHRRGQEWPSTAPMSRDHRWCPPGHDESMERVKPRVPENQHSILFQLSFQSQTWACAEETTIAIVNNWGVKTSKRQLMPGWGGHNVQGGLTNKTWIELNTTETRQITWSVNNSNNNNHNDPLQSYQCVAICCITLMPNKWQ